MPASDLSADIVRQIRNLGDEEIDALIAEHWGTVRETPAERAERIAEFKAMLTSSPTEPPDVALGRAVFVKTCCAVPHALRHRREGRPRADRLEPGRPRLRPVATSSTPRP